MHTIYTDFHKAPVIFDRLILLSKLHAPGFRGSLLPRLRNFKQKSFQVAKFNNHYSSNTDVHSDILEIPHLRPCI